MPLVSARLHPTPSFSILLERMRCISSEAHSVILMYTAHPVAWGLAKETRNDEDGRAIESLASGKQIEKQTKNGRNASPEFASKAHAWPTTETRPYIRHSPHVPHAVILPGLSSLCAHAQSRDALPLMALLFPWEWISHRSVLIFELSGSGFFTSSSRVTFYGVE